MFVCVCEFVCEISFDYAFRQQLILMWVHVIGGCMFVCVCVYVFVCIQVIQYTVYTVEFSSDYF